MADTICIIGNKGGTGKTTLSHMLAHGLGLLGVRVVAALTDTARDPLAKSGRSYLPLDARTPDALTKVACKLRTIDGWLGVLDGGANRPQLDAQLADMADLVLLPFRDSHEDMRTVRADIERFSSAYLLPSQWPTNAWQQEAAKRGVAGILGPYAERMLDPVYSLSASKLLLESEVPARLPTALNNACRKLAWQVLDLLGIELSQDTPEIVLDATPIAVVGKSNRTHSAVSLAMTA